MASSNNLLLMGLTGSIGTMTVKNYNGKIVVCKKIGKREKKATPTQKENEQNFRWANEYAKKIYKDPLMREEARLRLNVPHGNKLYRAILQDCRLNMINNKPKGKEIVDDRLATDTSDKS